MRFIIYMYISLVSFFIVGCSSVVPIKKNYINEIDFSNGINATEALLIAKKQLISSDVRKKYILKSARVLSGYCERQYSRYWFVRFDARAFDESFWSYLVVIDKETGNIRFAGEYVPLQVFGYKWVFDNTK